MFSCKVVIIFVACLGWTFAVKDKYCSLCDNHTMCIYVGDGAGCYDTGVHSVSETDKKVIVKVHNMFRQKVASGNETRGVSGGQPQAADLRKFVWDDDLAEVAQTWANQCYFGHDTCRRDPRWYVGQNIYWKIVSSKKPLNWTEAIASWYNEVEKFDSKDIAKYRFDFQTAHYTQLLWHETYAIGCGAKEYGDNKAYVCNYGPGGNMLGDPMYKVGEPCSSCPEGTTCENFLCANTTLNSRALISSDRTTNPYWRSNVIQEESGSSISETNAENTEGEGTAGEGDEDIVLDEATTKDINKILLQVENLLKTSIKKFRNMGKEEIKAPETIPRTSEYIQSNIFRQLLYGQ